jgi:4-hydroxy-tetrahydrodipicolinate synthase
MSVALWVANVTPFTADGEVDHDLLAAHTRWMVSQGVDGLAPAGTTGGFLFLTHAERRAIHRTVLAHADGAAVCPHVFDPDPRRIPTLVQAAADEGATSVFLAPPVFRPVSEDAVLRWYDDVVRTSPLPVLAYHHPRTHNPLHPSLVERLRTQVGVWGLKDSSTDDERIRRLSSQWPGRVFVGGDGTLGRADELGPIAGHISGLGNGWPALARRLVDGHDDREERDRIRALLARAGGTALGIRAHLKLGHRPPQGPPTEHLPPGLPPHGFTIR